MLDFAIPDSEQVESARTDPAWGDVIPSETLLEGVRRFKVSVLNEPGREESLDDNDTLTNDLPPGVRVEWALEDTDWPPLVVAFDGFRATQ